MKHADILAKMTLEEKTSLLSGKNFWESMDYPEYGIPGMFLSDGPHGLRKQAASADQLGLNPSLPATCFPTASALANSWDKELLKEVGKALGEEAIQLDVNMLLGPGINIKRDPRCGRCFEYFSEDPYLAGKLSANMIQGIQENGISACVKHFAANSQEKRRIYSDSIIDERTLREIYLTNFEIAVKEGKPMSIMSSYNMCNGYFTNENPYLMKEVLRDAWGYEGIVVTDWGGENDRIAGLLVGNELEMPGNNGDTDREIARAVKAGTLDEKVVDEACDRIIDLAIRTSEARKAHKLTTKIEKDADGNKLTGMHCYPEMEEAHHQIAKRASDETMVLLKNDDGILPFKKEDKVAVIGDFANAPRYQGAGSSLVNATRLDNFADLVGKFKFGYVGFAAGFNRYGKKDKKLYEEAIELAKKADIILYFLGLDEVTESEGLDRETINLPQNQIDLLKDIRALGKKVVALLSTGAVVDMSWDKYCDGVLHGALSGQAGCNAILDIINGDLNPSGKLSETYPCSYEDTPARKNFSTGELLVPYKEGLFVGYRYYDKNEIPVKYPFGFGLSFTTFEYSDLVVSEKGVEVKITNTGKVAGKEIVQLYVGMKDSKIFRPAKELKGFEKTKLLAPGESQVVSIPFDDKTFRYFNVKTHKFEVEGGLYQLYISASSRDVRLEGVYKKLATTDELPYSAEELPSYFSGKVTEVSDEEFKKLYGKELPATSFTYVNEKKKKIHVTMNNLFCDLPRARGWTGRLTGRLLRFLVRFGNKHNKNLANMIEMGPYGFPVRALSRMMGMPMKSAEGIRMMFDGHFFKGLGAFIKGDKEAPKYKKETHYLKPEKKSEEK